MNPRTLAAHKAVTTFRLNKISNISRADIEALSREIIALEYAFDDDMSRDAIIAKNIGPTTWKSFCRFGDRASASAGLILYWINNKAMSLDEQAMWMSENFQQEFAPDELARFMIEHDRGLSSFEPVAKITQAKKLFKELTGFNWNTRFVKIHILQTAYSQETSPF